MASQQTTIKFPNITNIMSGKNVFVSGTESINICLGLLLRTSKGELLGDPQFGCNLMRYMHEPNDLVLQDLVREDILSAISLYEKRISVMSSGIEVTSDDNTVYVSISYTIIKTGTNGTFDLAMLRSDAS